MMSICLCVCACARIAWYRPIAPSRSENQRFRLLHLGGWNILSPVRRRALTFRRIIIFCGASTGLELVVGLKRFAWSSHIACGSGYRMDTGWTNDSMLACRRVSSNAWLFGDFIWIHLIFRLKPTTFRSWPTLKGYNNIIGGRRSR